jgi:2-polyprenyl-6-methoxyphenol hydroxylase-like FAD-dependent oxidoreductase
MITAAGDACSYTHAVKILIVGAGIGGLTSALSLSDAGFDVEVFESVPALRSLGVGINLLPHAVRELDGLRLQGELERIGIATAELVYYSKRGQRIWREDRGIAAGYRWPQISIHRGWFHQFLLDSVYERLGRDSVHADHHCVGIEDVGSAVVARFTARSGERRNARGDVLIGADGIHSRVRAALHPAEGRPPWNGAWLWRGVSRAAPFLTGRSMIMAGHARHKFVCYPIGVAEDGQAEINWVAELHGDAQDLPPREDWNRLGRLEDFLPKFEDWRFDWLDVPDLIRRAPEVYVYPMVDRDPLPRWGSGRVTLLGDAAHPMYPIGSNGASQAILDARVLTGCLREIANPAAALAVYERVRRPPTSALVLANRRQGPEECMTLVESRAPAGFTRLDDIISIEELTAIADKYKRLAGFAIAELNASPSLADIPYDQPE